MTLSNIMTQQHSRFSTNELKRKRIRRQSVPVGSVVGLTLFYPLCSCNSLPKQLWEPLAHQSLCTATTTDSTPLLVLSSYQFPSTLKIFLFNQSFPPKSVCTNSCRFSGPLTWLTVFISLSFSLCYTFSPRSLTLVSVNKFPSVIDVWQA